MNLNCHCKNIEIEATLPEQVTICNCSICSRYQTLWAYYKPGDVKITIGPFGSGSYIWGDKVIEFFHCKNCGCITHYQTIGDTENHKVGINFRMVPQETVEDIPVRYFNGKELL